ncbi:outer membrane protein [Campylobacter concisus]|uniref:Outer membrane beta-barrel protein n=1 Tax=Campylobacter concisus TaxID=199 RepID=A0A7S9WY97_9BACT|nr:outer membrane beta-barrel protein [Campylobacter concisus]QPH97595.1 outer membrane beta-barrel protein [Campylobacter concisus]QPI04792.1 outer membrane beta-barrel protein [Campylobacter concisus]
MKNVVLKVALGLSLASAAALAQGAFVGFEGDYSFNSNLTAKSDNGKSKAKKAQPGLGIKAGYDFDVARVYGAYIYDFQAKKSLGDEDGTIIKWKTHKFIVGADYTPSVAKDLKLVLGGYTGFSKLKMDVFDTHDGSEKGNATGWILGARVGAEYSINENNAVEFGLKADRTDYGKINKFNLVDIKETNVGLYMGYTYKF